MSDLVQNLLESDDSSDVTELLVQHLLGLPASQDTSSLVGHCAKLLHELEATEARISAEFDVQAVRAQEQFEAMQQRMKLREREDEKQHTALLESLEELERSASELAASDSAVALKPLTKVTENRQKLQKLKETVEREMRFKHDLVQLKQLIENEQLQAAAADFEGLIANATDEQRTKLEEVRTSAVAALLPLLLKVFLQSEKTQELQKIASTFGAESEFNEAFFDLRLTHASSALTEEATELDLTKLLLENTAALEVVTKIDCKRFYEQVGREFDEASTEELELPVDLIADKNANLDLVLNTAGISDDARATLTRFVISRWQRRVEACFAKYRASVEVRNKQEFSLVEVTSTSSLDAVLPIVRNPALLEKTESRILRDTQEFLALHPEQFFTRKESETVQAFFSLFSLTSRCLANDISRLLESAKCKVSFWKVRASHQRAVLKKQEKQDSATNEEESEQSDLFSDRQYDDAVGVLLIRKAVASLRKRLEELRRDLQSEFARYAELHDDSDAVNAASSGHNEQPSTVETSEDTWDALEEDLRQWQVEIFVASAKRKLYTLHRSSIWQQQEHQFEEEVPPSETATSVGATLFSLVDDIERVIGASEDVHVWLVRCVALVVNVVVDRLARVPRFTSRGRKQALSDVVYLRKFALSLLDQQRHEETDEDVAVRESLNTLVEHVDDLCTSKLEEAVGVENPS